MMSKIFIKIASVKKQYTTEQGVKHAIKGVSLDIYRGEILGLLGVNGAGKTTLSSIIAGIHPATSGDILYQDKSIYDDIVGYRRHVGFCPQKPNLDLTLSLEENLFFAGRFYGIPANEVKERVKTLIEQFNLQEYAQQKASVLSGGYKQRFLIARSLIHHPQLIILDEPTVGLDPQIRRELWQHILWLKARGSSIILTTHYIEEAEELSDRVCIIDTGEIKVIDTPSNLKKLHNSDRLEDVFLTLTKQDAKVGQ